MQLEYAPFRRALNLNNAKHTYTFREGLYLRFCPDNSRARYYGEIAPLPGVSKESLDDCKQQLFSKVSLLETIISGAHGDRLLAAVRFAAESIFLASNDSAPTSRPTRCSALISGFPNVLLQKESGILAIKRGFHHLKIKISPQNIDQLEDLLGGILFQSSEKIYFRLDANQSLSPDSLEKLAGDLSDKTRSAIEYVEDPYPQFWKDSISSFGLPLAVDEHSDSLLAEGFFQEGLVFVVKPMVGIGLLSLSEKLLRAKELGHKIILSSSLETEVGLIALRNFSLRFADHDLAHGLSTAELLQDSLLQDTPILPFEEALDRRLLDRLDSLAWVAL